MNKVYLLLKNIKYLCTHNVREEILNSQYDTLLSVEDYCNYEADENYIPLSERLKIFDYSQTINILLNDPKSFCRFGDGEIELICGNSIPFQTYNEKLANILLNILKDDETDLYVGINYNYFHSTKILNDYNRKFYMLNVRKYRNFLLENCTRNRDYIAAGFNQLYVISDSYDYEKYYAHLKSMFKGKELVLFIGKGVLTNIKYDIFDECKSKTIIEGPSKNAFSQYDSILKKAKSFSKEKTLCFILGPTSKALVYALAKEGYMAWDIGHLAKDYDMYMKNIQKNPATINDFFQPD